MGAKINNLTRNNSNLLKKNRREKKMEISFMLREEKWWHTLKLLDDDGGRDARYGERPLYVIPWMTSDDWLEMKNGI